MRQILQSLTDGATTVAEVPAPQLRHGSLLTRTTRSLISAGTERMLVDFGRAGWIEKARQQPEKVRQVIDKIRADGLLPTIEAVRSTLEGQLPLGYCNVGSVVEIGNGVHGFAVGDRVVSNGQHAEFVCVPRNLCAHVPDCVSDDDAAFTVLGAIALQGVRLVVPTLGERIVVMGLGLIGLLTVQILHANGCKVLGIDPDQGKTALAQQFGAEVVLLGRGEDPLAAAEVFSGGQGVDAVLITAATRSNEPVSQAASMCRRRGRIVLVGVVGLKLNRADFYRKELSFQVSCSYGPGRYDPEYEEKGSDYPYGFVRWTEQRNFEAVLDMMATGRLQVKPLITHRFALESAPDAYELLTTSAEPYLGLLLDYPKSEATSITRTVVWDVETTMSTCGADPGIAFIGAGNYAGRVLIPAFAGTGAGLRGIASSSGVTAAHFGRKFRFARATTETAALIAAADVDAVVIATRHDSHAGLVIEALAAGKHVFVEKPLAITRQEVDAVAEAWSASGPPGGRPQVMVGFNRRFAPQVQRMKTLLEGVHSPKSLVMIVNAGALPETHWTQDPLVGGRRIIGEACHFVDLMRFLAGHPIVDSRIQTLGAPERIQDDKSSITLVFADGSWGAIHYLANGHAAMPKERLEVFCAGRVLQLNNFRRLSGHGWPGFKAMTLRRQDKGQKACAQAFIDAVRQGGAAPIPFEQLLEVSRTAVALGEAARS